MKTKENVPVEEGQSISGTGTFTNGAEVEYHVRHVTLHDINLSE